MVGKLVKGIDPKNDKFWGIGIVLDYRSTGRFYPSTELRVHFPTSEKGSIELSLDIKLVRFLDESR
tara:strand:+ start:456 stop:653 length:198 start_codon:yes stop_codon:yes gene_type:complete